MHGVRPSCVSNFDKGTTTNRQWLLGTPCRWWWPIPRHHIPPLAVWHAILLVAESVPPQLANGRLARHPANGRPPWREIDHARPTVPPKGAPYTRANKKARFPKEPGLDLRMVPTQRLELWTPALRERCSTN